MRKSNITSVISILVAALALNACAVIDEVHNARQAVNAFYGFKTIAGVQAPFPAYAQASVASFSVQIVPREGQDAAVISRTMTAAMVDYARRAAAVTGLRITVCSTNCPAGQRIAANFTEKGYHKDIVNRIAMGDKLRGNLRIIDTASGNVEADQEINAMKTYADVVEFANAYIGGLIGASASKANDNSDKQNKAMVKRLNALDKLPKRYAKVLDQAA